MNLRKRLIRIFNILIYFRKREINLQTKPYTFSLIVMRITYICNIVFFIITYFQFLPLLSIRYLFFLFLPAIIMSAFILFINRIFIFTCINFLVLIHPETVVNETEVNIPIPVIIFAFRIRNPD